MKSKKLLRLVVAGVLVGALVGVSNLALGQQSGGSSAVSQGQLGKKMTVKGRIKLKMSGGGYYIRSRPESYNIANQNPEILAPLAKSAEMVTIEAFSSGDLLTIDTINGKKYQNPPQPPSK